MLQVRKENEIYMYSRIHMSIRNVARRKAWSPSFMVIFSFLLAYCGIFENGALLMYTLEGVSSVANFIIAYEESQ